MEYDDNIINKICSLLNYTSNAELRELVYKLIEERNALKKLVIQDSLTMLNNRRILFQDDIDYDFLVMCDIDDFKGINDTYGHATGDEVLKYISAVLKTNVDAADSVCRYGGDEFTIIFRNCCIDDAVAKLNIIKESIMHLNVDINMNVSMSFGLTEYSEGKTIENAIKEADSALYQSKKSGKNRITLYTIPKQKNIN